MPPLLLRLLLVASLGLAAATVCTAAETPFVTPSSYEVVAAVEDDAPVEFRLTLRAGDAAALSRVFERVSDPKSFFYGRHVSKAEADRLAAPSDEARAAVEAWLASAGGGDARVARTADGYRVATTSRAIGGFFGGHVRMADVRPSADARPLRRAVGGALHVPDGAAAHVLAVHGLTERVGDSRAARRASVADGARVGALEDDLLNAPITPANVREAYNIPNNARNTNGGNLQAVVGFDDRFDAASLDRFQQLMGLRNWTVSTAFGQDVAIEFEQESDVDVQYLMAIGQDVETDFYTQAADEWLVAFLDELDGQETVPYVVVISYGWPEVAMCEASGEAHRECEALGKATAAYVELVNTKAQKLGARGVSLIAAAGDNGAPGDSDNCPVQAPASAAGEDHCSQLTVSKGETYCNFPFRRGACLDLAADPDCQVAMEEFANGDANAALCPELSVEGWEGVNPILGGKRSVSGKCKCDVLQPREHNGCKVTGYDPTVSKMRPLVPDFPASSPYFTAVGATSFTRAPVPVCRVENVLCPRGEVVASTSNSGTRITSGGGFSTISAAPAYQQAAVAAYLALDKIAALDQSAFDSSKRAYPDVSVIGTGCLAQLRKSGALQAVDGSSCSAPVFAGIVSLLNGKLLDHGKTPLGFLNPLLYMLGAEEPEVFNDIKMGANNCYSQENEGGLCCEHGFLAAEGWDAASGLGSVDYPKLRDAVYVLKDLPVGEDIGVTPDAQDDAQDEGASDDAAHEGATGAGDADALLDLLLAEAPGSDWLEPGNMSSFGFIVLAFYFIPLLVFLIVCKSVKGKVADPYGTLEEKAPLTDG